MATDIVTTMGTGEDLLLHMTAHILQHLYLQLLIQLK
jgi:hypothetical protein